MATKAEGFRSRQERSGPKKAKAVGRKGRKSPKGGTLLGRRDRSKKAARKVHARSRSGTI
jgi:hypothetical protein